ncbi:MAG TPA: T9SS type A sorting domain-containing protein, partial [Chitinophagaceae bacterium]|nr:T9SS type A sorting domain-containing protein [Chitinophagaceae bacterium]
PIYTGTQSPVTVPASKFAVIGNPYPSALDMRNITKTGMKDFFYVWDPLLGGTYGYGGFQTFSSDGNGNYIVIPGGGSYGPMGSISNYIQSGQAFFMQATSSGGSVTMKESAKTSGSRLVNGMQGLPSPRLTVSLYGNPGGQSYMADGFIVDYGTQFSNSVDDMDAIKSANSSENLSDKREGSLLVVERRQPVSNTDTININMSGISAQNYYFVIDATGLSQPSLTGYLLDKFTGAKTPLQTDGSTTVNFSVTSAAGSNAANRFEIIFSAPAGILPVTFTGVSAVKDDNAVKILWDVSNETNIKGYEVQHSTDGISFITIDNKSPLANNGGAANYTTIDSDASSGMNYYRIMSTDIDGKTAYSKIVKVNIDNAANTGITAYPNPITNNTIHLRILYKPAGDYNVRLISDAGKLILRQTVSNPGGYLEHLIKVPSGASAGMYHLEVIEPGGAIHEFNLIK